VTAIAALLVIVGLQAAFVVLTIALLFVTRLRGSRSRARSAAADDLLAVPLRRIMLNDDRGEALAAALLMLRPEVAAREMLAIGGARLSPGQRSHVAKHVRQSPWVRKALDGAHSRKWWKRLEAARLLVMVCDRQDAELVARLVTDRHAAVASAATAAIAACASEQFVRTIVDALPMRPLAVRLQQCHALRSHAPVATDAVASRLSGAATPAQTRAWIQLAEVLATPAALAAVVQHASHPDAEVRTAAARALRNCFTPDSAAAVTRMLGDPAASRRDARRILVGEVSRRARARGPLRSRPHRAGEGRRVTGSVCAGHGDSHLFAV
jgi:HEAT repeat protein